jgi:ferric enterobactin receptor
MVVLFHTQSYSGSGSAATPRGGVINTYNNMVRHLKGRLQ